MQLMLKALIVISIWLVYVGFFSEELVGSYFPQYGKLNRHLIEKAYQTTDKSNPQELIATLQLDLASTKFYTKVICTSNLIGCLGVLVFLCSLVLLRRERFLTACQNLTKSP